MAKEKTIKVRNLVAILVGIFALILSMSIWAYIVSIILPFQYDAGFEWVGIILALQAIMNVMFSIFLGIGISEGTIK